LYNRQLLVGDMNAGFQEIQAIKLRILAAKAKDNDRKLMKYRVVERGDADRPAKGFLRAAQVKALRTPLCRSHPSMEWLRSPGTFGAT
jgi:hypothetical protein